MAKRRRKRRRKGGGLAPQAAPAEPGGRGAARVIVLPRPVAGVKVNEDTALTYGAVWACVRVITEALACLPLHAYRKRPGGGRDEAPEHVADWLLHTQANPETPAFQFRETVLAHALTWGNGYAEIERDGAGRPVWQWQLTPDRVNPDRTARGKLIYDVANPREPNTVLDPPDVIHLRGLGFDGLVGYSVISMASRAIGCGIAADEAASGHFANDSTPGGYLKHPGRLSEKARENLRETFTRRHGGPSNRRTLAILEENMEWQQTGLPPEDSQLLQTRQYGPLDICRFMKVPPHKIAELTRATFSNIEQQEIEFVIDTLMPWAVRFEQEANIKLFGRTQRGQMFVKHTFNGRLRGDATARAAFYQMLLDRGVYSVNDVLELEDMNPIGPDGDKRFVQANMQLLENAGEEPPAPPAPQEEGPDVTPQKPEEQAPPAGWRGAALAVLEDACARALRRERHRADDAHRRLKGEPEKLAAWADEFRAGHAGYLRETVAPGVRMLCELLGRPDAFAPAMEAGMVALSAHTTLIAELVKTGIPFSPDSDPAANARAMAEEILKVTAAACAAIAAAEGPTDADRAP